MLSSAHLGPMVGPPPFPRPLLGAAQPVPISTAAAVAASMALRCRGVTGVRVVSLCCRPPAAPRALAVPRPCDRPLCGTGSTSGSLQMHSSARCRGVHSPNSVALRMDARQADMCAGACLGGAGTTMCCPALCRCLLGWVRSQISPFVLQKPLFVGLVSAVLSAADGGTIASWVLVAQGQRYTFRSTFDRALSCCANSGSFCMVRHFPGPYLRQHCSG